MNISTSDIFHTTIFSFLVLLLISCGGGGSDDEKDKISVSRIVGSSGGDVILDDTSSSISLNIPDGALNEEVTINIEFQKNVSVHDELKDFVDAENGAVFSFKPDGQVFAKPVLFNVTFGDIKAQTRGGITQLPTFAVVSIDSNGVTSAVDDLEINIDSDSGKLSLSGTLEHFSKMEMRPIPQLAVVIEGVPESPIAPGTEFKVNARITADTDNGISGVIAKTDDVTTQYIDLSVLPVSGGAGGEVSKFSWLNLNYVCSAGLGAYQSLIKLGLKEGVDKWRIGSPEDHILIPSWVIAPHFFFQRSVDCRPGKIKLSYNMLGDPMENESDSFKFEFALTVPAEEEIVIDIHARGDAVIGKDFEFAKGTVDIIDPESGETINTETDIAIEEETGLPFNPRTGSYLPYGVKIPAGELSYTVELHGLDDAIKDGNKNTTLFASSDDVALDFDPNVTIEWLDDVDDGTDPPTLNARGLTFVASPRAVTGYVGSTFQINLEQINGFYGDSDATRVVRVDISTEDPDGILSNPTLDDYKEGDGTAQPSLIYNQAPNEHGLYMQNTAVPSSNKQRLMFGCLKRKHCLGNPASRSSSGLSSYRKSYYRGNLQTQFIAGVYQSDSFCLYSRILGWLYWSGFS